MRVTYIVVLIATITLLSTICFAGDFSFAGTFTDLNQVQYFTFTVSNGSRVVIQSYGYAGGTNTRGTLIAQGGFDPVTVLFRGTTSSAPLFKTNDDEFGCEHIGRDSVTNVCYDIYWEAVAQSTDVNVYPFALTPGTYTVALLNYGNSAAGVTLGDGFTGGGSAINCESYPRPVTAGRFTDCGGSVRDGHWALDIKGVDSAQLGLQPAKPTSNSVSPATGTGSSQMFQFSFSDSAGFASITSARVVINSGLSAVNSCEVLYNASSQTVALMDDTGVTWSPNQKLGTAGTLQNSQCSIDTGASAASGSGNDLSLTLAATFKQSFGGLKNVYMYVQDKAGLNSGWQARGIWTVPAGAPTIVGATPATGSGTSGVFQYTFADGSGFGSITSARIVINTKLSAVHACEVLYNAASKSIALLDDAGSTWSANQLLGSTATLTNSQCSVNVSASSASGAGNNLTLKLALNFNSAFATSTRTQFGYVQNKFGLNSGWSAVGTWIIP